MLEGRVGFEREGREGWRFVAKRRREGEVLRLDEEMDEEEWEEKQVWGEGGKGIEAPQPQVAITQHYEGSSYGIQANSWHSATDKKGKGRAQNERAFSDDDEEEEEEEEEEDENQLLRECTTGRCAEEQENEVVDCFFDIDIGDEEDEVTALFNKTIRMEREEVLSHTKLLGEENLRGKDDMCCVGDLGDVHREKIGQHCETTTSAALPECSICFESLNAYNIAFVSGCMHSYCLDCILKWCVLVQNKKQQMQQQRRHSQHSSGNNVLPREESSASGCNNQAMDHHAWCPTCKGGVHSLLTYRSCFDDSVREDLQEETVHWWIMTQNNYKQRIEESENTHDDYDYHDDDYEYCDEDDYGCFHDAGMIKKNMMMMSMMSKKKKKKTKAMGRSSNNESCSKVSGRNIMISNRPFGKNGYTSSQGRQFARPVHSDSGSQEAASTSTATCSRTPNAQSSISGIPVDDNVSPPTKSNASYVSPATLKRQAKKEKKMEKEMLKMEKRKAKMASSPISSSPLYKSPSARGSANYKSLTEYVEGRPAEGNLVPSRCDKHI